jgi:hypothetical protein
MMEARRTPSAWMISPAFFLALRQILFSVRVTFDEYKWSILAERRSLGGQSKPAIGGHLKSGQRDS